MNHTIPAPYTHRSIQPVYYLYMVEAAPIQPVLMTYIVDIFLD